MKTHRVVRVLEDLAVLDLFISEVVSPLRLPSRYAPRLHRDVLRLVQRGLVTRLRRHTPRIVRAVDGLRLRIAIAAQARRPLAVIDGVGRHLQRIFMRMQSPTLSLVY